MSAERLLVVGLDASPGAARALGWALRHASGTGSAVLVITAFPSGSEHGFGAHLEFDDVVKLQRSLVAAALADVTAPPSVSLEVVEGHPVEVLVRAACDADMLVVGSHRRGPLGEVLFGSVSTGCIRHATTPVTVVPPTQPAPSRLALVAEGLPDPA